MWIKPTDWTTVPVDSFIIKREPCKDDLPEDHHGDSRKFVSYQDGRITYGYYEYGVFVKTFTFEEQGHWFYYLGMKPYDPNQENEDDCL